MFFFLILLSINCICSFCDKYLSDVISQFIIRNEIYFSVNRFKSEFNIFLSLSDVQYQYLENVDVLCFSSPFITFVLFPIFVG